MLVHALHHVSLIVADTGRALEFYQGVLGLTLDLQRPDLGYPGAWLHLPGGQQLHLLQLPSPDPRHGRPEHGGRDRHIAMHVTALDDLAMVLTQAHIPFTRSRSGRRALFCRDPDGNALEFIEQSTNAS
jgi:glyoxylase I family protein